MSATKDRLYTGLYECTECDARYRVDDVAEDDLVCEACGADLEIDNNDGDGDTEDE